MVAEKFSTIVVAAVFLSFAWNRDRTIVNSKEIEMMMISLIRNGTSLRKQSHCKESDLDTVPSLDLCLSLVVCVTGYSALDRAELFYKIFSTPYNPPV